MIELIQRKINTHDLCNPYNKLAEIELHLNKEIIASDILRIKASKHKTKNKFDKENKKALIHYLEKLLKRLNEDSIFEMCWTIKEDLPESYPIKIINEPLYGINTCNYIETVEEEKIVEIDLTNLADIIAFEFMYKDLGETHESMEKLLSSCGIIGFEDSKLLTDLFKKNNDKVYELSKSMLISDTPYLSIETNKIHDYFHSIEIRDTGYRKIVEYSCRYASIIIMNTIIKNAIQCNINCKPIMINATNITFIVNIINEDIIKEKIIDNITVRTFGRRFVVATETSIY